MVDQLRRVHQAFHRETAHRRLVVFYLWPVAVEVEEVTRLATTIDTWQEEILTFFDTRAQNGPTEGANAGSSRSAG